MAFENNNLLLPRPAPVPVPGLPLSPGEKVVQDANNNIASNLDKALKGAGTGEKRHQLLMALPLLKRVTRLENPAIRMWLKS